MYYLKALQKRIQKDENRFFVEIDEKNERLKNRGMSFIVIDYMARIFVLWDKKEIKLTGFTIPYSLTFLMTALTGFYKT